MKAPPWQIFDPLAFGIGLCMLLLCKVSHAAVLLHSSDRIGGLSVELFVMPLILNGDEKNSIIEVATTAGRSNHFLAMAEFMQAMNFKYNYQPNHISIHTPLGVTSIPHDDCQPVNGKCFISTSKLSNYLAIDVAIELNEFAIKVNSTWIKNTQIKTNQGNNEQVDLIGPPPQQNNLSYIRNELFIRRQNDQTTEFIETDLAGQLFTGIWEISVHDHLDDDPFLDDYSWIKTTNKSRYFLGNQAIALNPLLESSDFTGFQMAWTNNGILPFINRVHDQQLINDALGNVRSFHGRGIPGGLVELRVEGVRQAQTITRLDGTFQFNEIEIQTGGYVEIEAWVYEPNVNGVPHEIIDLSGYNTNRNIPKNTWLLQTGAGVNGNAIETPNSQLDNAFYLRSQYTLNDAFTFNGIVQNLGDNTMSLAGLRGYWGGTGFWQLHSAHQNGDHAWRIENINQGNRWAFRAALEERPAGWLNTEDDVFKDQYAEIAWRPGPQFELSLIHRNHNRYGEPVKFTRPAAKWRPNHRFSAQARPDYNGEYNTRLHWKINKKQHVNLFAHPDEQAVNWYHKISQFQHINVQYLDRDEVGRSTSVIYRHARKGIRSLGGAAGLLYGEGNVGFLAQLDYEWLPGLYMRFQALKDPLKENLGGDNDIILGLNVVATFNVGSGGITRGRYHRYRNHRSTLSGRIKGLSAKPDSVEPLWILVDGQRRAKTEQDGQFTIHDLFPGAHEIKLDLAGLPFEYKPIQDTQKVVLTAGGLTHIEFKLKLNLGVTGTVFDDTDNPVSSTQLTLLSTDTNNRAFVTDRSGRFRLDDLDPGQYIIRDQHQRCAQFELQDQYLIMQTIKLARQTICEVNHHD